MELIIIIAVASIAAVTICVFFVLKVSDFINFIKKLGRQLATVPEDDLQQP